MTAADIKTRFATIGDDGKRPVVWGLGDSVDEAHADAIENLRNVSATSTEPLRTVPISEERYARIAQGDVDASGL